MKRTVLLFITIMCFFLLGCSKGASIPTETETYTPQITATPSPGLEKEASVSLDEFQIVIPELYIEYNNIKYKAVSGTCSWFVTQGEKGKGLEGDSGPPEMLIDYQEEKILITEDGFMKIIFDREPTNYEVKIWNIDDYDSSQVIEAIDDKIYVTKNMPTTIYQVTAKFKFSSEDIHEEGTVYYAFVINQNNIEE